MALVWVNLLTRLKAIGVGVKWGWGHPPHLKRAQLQLRLFFSDLVHFKLVLRYSKKTKRTATGIPYRGLFCAATQRRHFPLREERRQADLAFSPQLELVQLP